MCHGERGTVGNKKERNVPVQRHFLSDVYNRRKRLSTKSRETEEREGEVTFVKLRSGDDWRIKRLGCQRRSRRRRDWRDTENRKEW